jgi:hypothetical protein
MDLALNLAMNQVENSKTFTQRKLNNMKASKMELKQLFLFTDSLMQDVVGPSSTFLLHQTNTPYMAL